jgi:hypothetical protein
LLEALKPGQTYGTSLALATYQLSCSELDGAGDWMERVIVERHPAVFFTLRVHARELLQSARGPALASMLNLAE